MKTRLGVLACLALSGALAGCARDSPAAGEAKISAVPATPSIAWFQGDVEAAFARAKAEGKPVFVYWGAEWCPPCHQLKATVFSRPDFVEKTKLFIPVYLDGDSAGAQKWADTFHVSGYPTLVILTPDRRELTRIIGGFNLSEYDDVLDLVLGEERPVRVILDSLSDPKVRLTRDDCKRLAYNAWAADTSLSKAPEAAANELLRAALACPTDAPVERARLDVAATHASLSAESKTLAAGDIPTLRTSTLLDEVYAVLGNPETAAGARDVLSWLGDDYFMAEQRSRPQRAAELLDRWTRNADAIASNASLPEAERIEALGLKLKAVQSLSPDHRIPPVLAESARQQVETSLAKDYPDHARPAVVNAAQWIFDILDDRARMRSLLEQEISTARQPYYYMLDLASVEEKEGNEEVALALLERAYRASQGAATRFQWGTSYVMGLIRMRPGDSARIRDATLAVLAELDGPDRIYMRTAARLERLDSSLRDWNAEGTHAAAIQAIRERISGICQRIPQTQPARSSCDGFLS